MLHSRIAILASAALFAAHVNSEGLHAVSTNDLSIVESTLIATETERVEGNPCDEAESAAFAQCDLANTANEFHWVDESEYRDNVVQVVYGPSTCGGLLLDGDLILTARHCTPDWNETTEWTYGNSVKIFQGIEAQANKNLVFEGQAEIIVRDTDQRVEDGIDFLTENWVPIVDSMLENWRQIDGNAAGAMDYDDLYFNGLRSRNTSQLNDVAIIKLPVTLAHSKSNALITLDNLDSSINTSYDQYDTLVTPPVGTKFIYQGWGKNAYGVTPEQMKEWELSFNQGQVDMFDPSFGELLGNRYIYLSFNLDNNFFKSCDEQALINEGDSGTPLFSQDDYMLGVASRISGESCGFSASWSANLTNYEFYKTSINRLVAPSELRQTVYTDSGTPSFTFDVQNLSYDSRIITPSLLGAFNMSHDCPQTLAPLEHCRLTVSYEGDTQNPATVNANILLDTNKVIPINLDITGTLTPTDSAVEHELPSAIELHIGLDDPETVKYTIDVSWLSTPENILEPSMTLEFNSDEALFWGYGETEGMVDLSKDPTVGKYREAPTEWVVEFYTHRDLPEADQHLAAQPGVYQATISTSSATIPVTVYYREDEIPQDPDGDTGEDSGDNSETGGDTSDDTDNESQQDTNTSGSSGGSLGFISLIALLYLRRSRS